LQDTTAILFNYPDQPTIYKALNTLNSIDTKLKSIIVLQAQKMTPVVWSNKLKLVTQPNNDYGQLLNEVISQLNTSYVLFLHDTDYLSPTVQPNSLKIPVEKSVLGTFHHSRNMVIHRPVLVRTSLLKKEPFLLINQLPFQEALLPTWLANVESQQQVIKENLIRKSRIHRSANALQKEKIMGKYHLKKSDMQYKTISVLISTYNMAQYLETAIVSCLLQNEPFDQILIIDDGSTDNTHQQLKRLEKEKQVNVFRKKNAGKARALNDLLPHVTSDFILELDADDWLDPDACSVIKKHVSDLHEEVAVLYGNFRKWKQTDRGVLFKKVAKGVAIRETAELLSYRFPLGPRVYRTSMLKKEGGFPVIAFEDGRLYEDVSVLKQLFEKYPFRYKDFTVYNVREHHASITKNNDSKWQDFLNILKSQ